MTDFLRSDWSLVPLLIWFAIFFPYQLVDGLRARRDWEVFWPAVRQIEGKRGPELDAVLAKTTPILDEQRPRVEARRRRQRWFLVGSIVALAWAAVRLPFSSGWV